MWWISRNLFKYLLVVVFFIVGCDGGEPTDEELSDAIFGVWSPSLIITEDGNKTPQKDSVFFFEGNRKLEYRFSSKGILTTNRRSLKSGSYFVLEKNLYIINAADTSLFGIEYVNSKKMVLNSNNQKWYWEKQVY